MNGKYVESLKDKSNIEKIYKTITQNYGNKEETLEKPDRKKIQEIIEKNGYICHYDSRERFYKVVLIDGEYKIGYNILLKYGVIELVFFIFKNGKCIDGGPVSWMFLNEEGRPMYPLPGFSTYEELEEILLPMFEVIKTFEPEKVFNQIE